MITQKTRYSDEELQIFEALIDKKLVEAKKQLEFYEKQIADLADNDDAKGKGLDDVAGPIEAERINGLAVRISKYIGHLNNAKMRIHNKVYGICRETGELISKERLMVVPHATLSIQAKQSRK